MQQGPSSGRWDGGGLFFPAMEKQVQLNKIEILEFINEIEVCRARAEARPDLADNLYATLAKDWANDCAIALVELHNGLYAAKSSDVGALISQNEIVTANVLPDPLFVQSSQSGVDSPDYAASGPGKLPE